MNAVRPLDEDSIKIGLLLETAQTQQELVASELSQLRAHTSGLDAVVRAQIRCTLVDELGGVIEESTRAVEALKTLQRAARRRQLGWVVVVTTLGMAVPAASAWWWLPSSEQMNALRSRREQLLAEIANLEQRGARIDLRRCGSDQRWCVRVDRQAPVYGQQADYLIVKGY